MILQYLQQMNNEIELGLDFILSHLEQPTIFPRTIMTKKIGYQRKVYSKERALEHFIESDFIDCRINAFPLLKEGSTWVPELLFIDLDRNDFKTEKGFKFALSTTLRNIREIRGISYCFIYWWRISYLSTCLYPNCIRKYYRI